jgi:multidrug efflux pump subunit AcrA (membrane-fusion protein)
MSQNVIRHPASSPQIDWRGRLPAIALVGSSRASHVLARVLILGCFFAILGLIFLPWQQSVRGTGRVIAFDPLDRRMDVQAPVAGRVKELRVVEGQTVKKGDVIAELQDNDPNLLDNLRGQRDSVESRILALRQRVSELSMQLEQQASVKLQALAAARQKVASEQVTAETARLHYERTESLARGGLVSQRDLELAIQGRDSSAANLAAAKANLIQTEREYDASLSRIRADRTQVQGDLATAERDRGAAEVLVSQTMQQQVVAPRDGFVLRVSATEGTFLRPGSPIATIIPEAETRFAEVWLQGNDVPLVSARRTLPDGRVIPGSPVRLRFEGWPAIQFVGWPSVAIGTFGGEVVFVDATDDGAGKFRVVVAPKPDIIEKDGKTIEQPWPKNQWLRQGVRVDGWVLLQQLPLWKEAWRQLNAFPPTVADKEPE